MYHLFKSYINFLFRSTNQHGVHSPFVYSLVTRCFYDRKKYPAYKILKNYRKSLLKDERAIQVKDLGAGSRVFKSGERKVSKMAKTAGISPKRARLLNRLVRYLEIDKALELGTHLGLGTAAMAAGNDVKITTIEGCPETAAVAGEKFKDFGFNNIQLKVARFELFLKESANSKSQIPNSIFFQPDNPQPTTDNSQLATGNRQQGKNSKTRIPNPNFTQTENREPTTDTPQPTLLRSSSRGQATHNSELLTHNFDLLYIDGNHQKEATLSYFEKLLSTVHNDSVMIFDDIHWSKGMEEAWEEIKAHPEVRVTIDTFQWGLVFFRREQEKEHFVVRV